MIFYYGLLLAATFVVVAVLAFIVYVSYQHHKYGHLPGPKRQSFLFGNSEIIEAVQARQTTLPETMYDLHKKYGPVVCTFFLHEPFICVIDPKTAKELLMSTEYIKPWLSYRAFYKVFGQRFMGKGLVSEIDNSVWERHRKVLNPAFHRKYLMELMSVFNDSADRLTDYLTSKADGKTEVSLMDAFERVTLDVIAKAAFNMEDDMILEDTAFKEAIGLSFEGMANDLQSLFGNLDPRPKTIRYRKNVRKAIQLLRNTGEDIIRKRLADQKEGKELPKDILSFIVKTAMVEENFNLVEMVDEFVTFFGAGQETTSNLLSFTMLCLGQNPEALARVLNEVDTVIGRKEHIDYEDIIKLEYLSLVLKESLRLYPPVFGTGRAITKSMDVVGYNIPAGSTIFFCNYAMNRSEEYFKNPLTFDPERFRRDEDKPLYVYFPFSIGPRSCIGQQFALIESRVVLAKLLQKLNFRLVPGQNLGVRERLTLKPAGDCLNYITLRAK